MLKSLSIQTVREVIRLAEAANQDSKQSQTIDLQDLTPEQIADALEMKPEEIALNEYLKNLSQDAQAELMALMWLGRADHNEKEADFPDLLADAKENMDHAASYMAEKAPLADYLMNGLRTLGLQ